MWPLRIFLILFWLTIFGSCCNSYDSSESLQEAIFIDTLSNSKTTYEIDICKKTNYVFHFKVLGTDDYLKESRYQDFNEEIEYHRDVIKNFEAFLYDKNGLIIHEFQFDEMMAGIQSYGLLFIDQEIYLTPSSYTVKINPPVNNTQPYIVSFGIDRKSFF